MNAFGRLIPVVPILALAIGAALPGPALAQNSWKKVECDKSAIRNPQLTSCEKGPDSTGNTAGLIGENWAISGETKDGDRARLNLYKIVRFYSVVYQGTESSLEAALKNYYRNSVKNIPPDVTLRDYGTYKALKFRTADDTPAECHIFHKWGTLHTPSIATSGYNHWIRGFVCAPPGKDLAPDAVDRLLADVKVDVLF